MLIIGCDYHPSFQQIASVDTDTGELQERRLLHREEAEKFYRDLAAQGMKVRVGMEASGHARWFERLLAELNFELWIGDAAEIRTKRVRKRKTDREDAGLLLRLLLEDRFPRIWVPSWDNRDPRRLLWHPAADGADAHPDDEPVASRSPQRGLTLQEEVMAGAGTEATGDVPVGAVGQPTPRRSVGVTGPTERNHRRAKPSD
jgi:hypothetical protein